MAEARGMGEGGTRAGGGRKTAGGAGSAESAGEDQPRSPTIYDVAREAGVSASTVSRTFARPGRVSSPTAHRVREVAERIGYRAQPIYRAPVLARTRTIGLALSDITNPFYFPIIRGAESAAAAEGYTLLLADAQESDAIERAVIKRALPLLDGLVVASSRVSDADLRALAKVAPVVVLNRPVTGLPSVSPDVAHGVRSAVDHLADLGHRHLTYLAGPDASWMSGARWRAMYEAACDRDLAARRLGPFAPTVEGGREAAALVARHSSRAVLAYNDLMAMGLMDALRRDGLRVPADVSVIGIDNIFAADLVTPGLTTIAAPLRVIGETAVHNVLALARRASSSMPEPTVVPVRLIVRESTGPPL